MYLDSEPNDEMEQEVDAGDGGPQLMGGGPQPPPPPQGGGLLLSIGVVISSLRGVLKYLKLRINGTM